MRPTSAFSIFHPSWRALQVLGVVSTLLCIVVVYSTTWSRDGATYIQSSIAQLPSWKSSPETFEDGDEKVPPGHPIAWLMKKAQRHFDALSQQEARDLSDAARKYRAARGRHPPPGFDAWYAYATEHGALVVESFFDQIYRDLGPFWGMDVHALQHTVHTFSPKISVRGGTVTMDAKGSHAKMKQIMQMIQSLAKHTHVELPDVDVPVNANEEPAMLVPWDEMETELEFARAFYPDPKDVIDTFASIEDAKLPNTTFDPEWLGGRLRHTTGAWLGPRPLWSLIRPACPERSPARSDLVLTDIWDPQGHTKEEHSAVSLFPWDPPANTTGGYVRNWTMATDVCRFSMLQGLHGAFVAPESMSITKKLFPLISSSKLSMSNEILIPGFADWNASDDTATAPLAWTEKQPKLYWRGPASGGINTEKNWQRFHRHRFVAMLNATHVEIAEGLLHAGNETEVGLGYARNFRLLPGNGYHLTTQKGASMAKWIHGWADVAFMDMHCSEPAEDGVCPYVKEFFSIREEEGDDERKFKYSAVLDGNSGEGDGSFIRSLLSGRVTLRASVYRQWYDSRVIPWLHFIPIDNTFVDLYGIMEYFIGTSARGGGNDFAHAFVEVPKHEHHFKTPNVDDEPDPAQEDEAHGKQKTQKRGRRGSIDTGNEPEGLGLHLRLDGRDAQAQKIAEASQKWAQKVLRKEDMLIYMYRLLLEYARVIDDRRQVMGWVGDLVEEGE